MTFRGYAVAVLLIFYGQVAAASPPQHIMSLAICTDELLMDLVPPERIASVSYLSREKAALKLWPQAARIAVNHNSAEEVLTQKPDLVLTLPYNSSALRPLLAKTGAKMIEVPEVQTFDQIRAITRLVGNAVGESARAERLIAQMDEQLRQLAPPSRTIRVAGWGGGGFVPGRGTLFNTVLEAAGGTNIAGANGGNYDLEGLLAARPDILAFGDDYIETPSLRAQLQAHPLLLKYFAGRRIIYPSALLGCGVPQTAGAVLAFHAALTAAMKNPGGVPVAVTP